MVCTSSHKINFIIEKIITKNNIQQYLSNYVKKYTERISCAVNQVYKHISEIENRNERIQNLLREIDSLNATLRDATEDVKTFFKDSKHD